MPPDAQVGYVETMSKSNSPLRVGVAGWSIPANLRRAGAPGATLLHHYAAVFDIVEINSSFYRPHRVSTYERWAGSVPDEFRFAVKIPRTITHECTLADCETEVDDFLIQVRGLGHKLAVLLLQLPPSLAFDDATARAFFRLMTQRCRVRIVCEPRHPSWGGVAAETVFSEFSVTRVIADPDPVRHTGDVLGEFAYLRLHGSPRTYYSSYSAHYLADLKTRLSSGSTREAWCIFDNTAQGAAWANAYEIRTNNPP